MEKKTILILAMALSYLLIINVLANININLNFQSDGTGTESSGNQINFGNSVTYEVKRPRLFYTIYETEGKSTLQLFDVIPIPLKTHNFNLVWFHLVFIGGLGYVYKQKNLFKREEK